MVLAWVPWESVSEITTHMLPDNITLNQIRTESSFNLKSLYEAEDEYDNNEIDSPFQYAGNNCDYYEMNQLHELVRTFKDCRTYFHLNCRGLSSSWDSFYELLCNIHNEQFSFDIIGISEVFHCANDSRISLPGYHELLTRCRPEGSRGGVGLFVKEHLNYKIREDLSVFIPHVFESIFIEIRSDHNKNVVVGVIYRPNSAPKADLDIFSTTIFEIMEIINNEQNKCILMGDMNIDLIKYETHIQTCEYLDNIFSHGFLPVITLPTRVTATSATLIDHIYINDTSNVNNSGIIITDVADHFGTFYSTNDARTSSKNKFITTRSFSDTNVNKFRNYLDQMNFINVFNLDCPNDAYNEFITLYKMAFDKAFPIRNIKITKNHVKREPWITTGLMTSSRTKAKLFTKKLNKPSDHNINLYKNYNNTFNKLKRTMKINYFKSALDSSKLNMKRTWSVLKKAIGKQNNKSSLPNYFVINNNNITNRSQAAKSFNDYFCQIGLETSNNVPASTKHFTDYMHPNNTNSMFLSSVGTSQVIEATKRLKSKTSSGHDQISTKLLKETIENIIEPITYIINRSLETGIIPEQMKIAKVIPIHKKADPTLIQNYRPISLLPAFSKILEKIMYKKVVSFLESNNLLNEHQYGFRPKHSTIHPIIHLLNHCADVNNKSNKEFTLAIFCDLSKAFDVIDHEILLKKLNTYGLRGNVNKWFRNYLSNRSQYVDLEGEKSPRNNIFCGVPQGSILGPLLYLIYVNDIRNSCKSKILSFADDTTLYVSHSDINLLYVQANSEINNLFQWFSSNKLSLNADKTKYIVIRPHQRRCNLNELNIHIRDTNLNRVGKNCSDTALKFLGLYIDESLSWKKQIAHINTKIARASFAINQVKNFLPEESLRTLYHALVYPHLSYGILAWGAAGPTALKTTIILQKRILRTINKAKFNSHTDPLFKNSDILKIMDLYEYNAAIFMHDFIHNELPLSFKTTFKFNHQVQTIRQTRQSNLLFVPRCRSCFSEKLPVCRFPNVWNKLKNSIRIITDREIFKTTLKSRMINLYPNRVRCKNRYCKDCYP